ncbi:hypothetical protein K8R33_02145 [archaeon]|nr:hypothetical protein [archaeon]
MAKKRMRKKSISKQKKGVSRKKQVKEKIPKRVSSRKKIKKPRKENQLKILKTFIVDAREKGMKEGEIRHALLEKKWPRSLVVSGFSELKPIIKKQEKEVKKLRKIEYLPKKKKTFKPIQEKEEIPKKKEIPKEKLFIAKKQKPIQQKKRNNFGISLLILFIILGGIASFLTRHLYVYVISAFFIVIQAIFTFIKPKKRKPFEQAQEKKKVEKEIKPEPKKKKGRLKVFLFILFIILGGIASFLTRQLYVYVISAFFIVIQTIFTFIKPKKKKEIEEEKKEEETEKPVQPKKIYITDFDKFYNYISERKRAPLSSVAKAFKMQKEKAEEWATILEGRGLIKIKYPMMGDPELICKGN